eukprot:4766246-Amphidinium_carterae.2
MMTFPTQVVFSELYFIPHERSMYGFDGWSDAWSDRPWQTSELKASTLDSGDVPANMDVVPATTALVRQMSCSPHDSTHGAFDT